MGISDREHWVGEMLGRQGQPSVEPHTDTLALLSLYLHKPREESPVIMQWLKDRIQQQLAARGHKCL